MSNSAATTPASSAGFVTVGSGAPEAAGSASDIPYTSRVAERVLTTMQQVWDTGVLAFAGFTLLVHFMVFVAAGSFGTLRWIALALSPLAWVAWRVTRAADTDAVVSAPQPLPRSDRLVHFLIACALVASLALLQNYLVFWAGSLLFLAFAYLRSASSVEPLLGAAPTAARDVVVLVACIALSMLLTAIAHRPDTDDGFLINVPVWLLDNPGKVLYSEDGLHNLPGIPIVFPTYRDHAIEVLYAFLAWLLQLEPIVVAHELLPPISAALAVISSALLLRAWLPRTWALGTLALVAFWITMGDTHEGFANHAYVRIFQGKAIMVTALLPYLAYAVIRFMQTGRWQHWLLVQASVICAAGLSATGLFVAPLALGAAATACWKPTRQSSLRFLAALACAGYALAIALAMRSQIADKLAILNGDALYGYVKHFPDSYVQILGVGPYMSLHVLGVVGAPAVAIDRARRRFLAAAGFVYFALVMNPFVFDTWVKYVTSAPVAWRLWWMLPVPVLVACTMTAPFSSGAEGPRRRQIALFALTVLLAFSVVPRTWALSTSNGVRLAWPGLKVPPRAYALSEIVQRLTPRGYSVLAPREIAMWVTTRRNHPRVVAHKENTLKVMEPYMGSEQFGLRMHLFAYIGGRGRGAHSPRVLERALDRLHIGLVMHAQRLPWGGEIDGVMRGAGFVRKDDRGYVLWYRPIK